MRDYDMRDYNMSSASTDLLLDHVLEAFYDGKTDKEILELIKKDMHFQFSAFESAGDCLNVGKYIRNRLKNFGWGENK